MNYSQYTLNDFLVDDYFIRWVKLPDPQTNLFWEDWLEKYPEKKALVAEARLLVMDLSDHGKQLSEQDKKQLWANINQRRKAVQPPVFNRAKPETTRPILVNWMYTGRIAAAILAIMMVFTWLIWTNANKNSPTIHIRTQYSEIKNIALPDGSQVTLNGNSTLSYSEEWTDQNDREVQLTGEAFFDITKKSGKNNAKFIVHTQNLDVEVLGTQFNVNNRRNRVEVVLQEGKVGLSQSGMNYTPVVMIPGDYIEYSQATNKMRRKKVNPFVYSSWRENEMIFDDKPLFEIAQVLEDTKGIQLVFQNDSLKKLSFTGTLPHQDIDNFLLVLSKSFGVEVSKQGNQIMLRNK